uniref:Uncharacterized protein n=1 Tax=Salarias fasciatus TaxID=181472 RepID=A0A672FGU1_SALFA
HAKSNSYRESFMDVSLYFAPQDDEIVYLPSYYASSEYLSAVDLTDSEDAGRTGSTIGQDPSGQQVAVMGGSYAGLSPMIIMNNFVLKQVKLSSTLRAQP